MARDDIDWRNVKAKALMDPVVVGDTEVGAKYDTFEFTNGRAFVHRLERCDMTGRCAMHSPSDHNMRALPMLLRETTLIERTCPHGVGHPDPDSLAYFMSNDQHYMAVHGCDECCSRRWATADRLECPECGSDSLPIIDPTTHKDRFVCTNYGGCEHAPG